MSTVLGDDTVVRVVALTAVPLFVDVYGSVTGTIGGTYNPSFVGERGFMAYVDALPLDLPTADNALATGDLVICFNWTPLDIATAESSATPFIAAAGPNGGVADAPKGPFNVTINDVVRKYWIDTRRHVVLFDAIGGDEIPDAGVKFSDLKKTFAEYPDALAQINAEISVQTLNNP